MNLNSISLILFLMFLSMKLYSEPNSAESNEILLINIRMVPNARYSSYIAEISEIKSDHNPEYYLTGRIYNKSTSDISGTMHITFKDCDRKDDCIVIGGDSVLISPSIPKGEARNFREKIFSVPEAYGTLMYTYSFTYKNRTNRTKLSIDESYEHLNKVNRKAVDNRSLFDKLFN